MFNGILFSFQKKKGDVAPLKKKAKKTSREKGDVALSLAVGYGGIFGMEYIRNTLSHR